MEAMLMRTDPFRELDRLPSRSSAPTAPGPSGGDADGRLARRRGVRRRVRPARRRPGLDRPRRRTQRRSPSRPNARPRANDAELIAAERPRGVFSRQLDPRRHPGHRPHPGHYDAGVLTLRIPVAEKAKPRKISISHNSARSDRKTIDT